MLRDYMIGDNVAAVESGGEHSFEMSSSLDFGLEKLLVVGDAPHFDVVRVVIGGKELGIMSNYRTGPIGDPYQPIDFMIDVFGRIVSLPVGVGVKIVVVLRNTSSIIRRAGVILMGTVEDKS